MSDSDVITVRYCPGLSRDLTEWQVLIGRNRWLRQKVAVWNSESEYHNQVLWFWVKLSRQHIADLWEIVDRIGFRDFRGHYKHLTMCITDCPSYWIAIRFKDRIKEVEVYDLRRLAEFEQQPDMIGFRELWEAITAHTPYERVPMAEGLPRPWWRFW